MYERSMTLLNETGDVTIAWSAAEDAKMLEMIERKMAEGYTFFIIKRRFKVFSQHKEIVSVADLKGRREVVLKDADAERLF